MVELEIIKLLNSEGIKAYMERPKNVPEEYVIVEKTGTSSKDWITVSTIAVKSHAKSLLKAVQLNEKVKKVMLCANKIGISSILLINDYNFTNIETKEYRYQAVFSVVTQEIMEG
ncbi:hypothetical protein [Bulleidia sp. zg-1006]|uniref:hypothetical protein n=1 Tax=Bulleidia sp. zg-1006 TaxID=2806552 RepID=UPI001939F3CC|nr:hypothetical protein [Bulleidia sp. zg-1006]QRG86373.1 hypothetical protein JOS54_05835 [Bulleidia sp. zg-1006]